ncbi:sensor histidine kinase [Pontivivens insulae]|uniref:histidine kinase n=1 Tax=Pontivivens insulae TaxID=1639689 RepID=A0A2R8ACK7_9RHOB|nr:ATP-binding protein [Pontivivens insulae]RED13893.1 two-component system C4-dicarboxylate transport sensor histidine kinase DctB [Pontivivens insulae]SPF29967.1 C4-dicarboxylate transport sensor protein DctB [Pontivivens insulae]
MAERRRIWGAAIAALLLATGLYLGLIAVFTQSELRDTPNRAAFFASTLQAELDRLEHLPGVIAHDPLTLRTLIDQVPAPLEDYLAGVQETARAEAIFVLDINGLTLAAAGREIDEYHTFRPYFREAVAGGSGRFYEVGLEARAPGYYIAEPVRDAAGTVFGAVVVKVSLAAVGRSWADSGALLLATDASGVVLVSSRSALLLGMTRELSAYDRRQLTRSRPAGDTVLHRLDWQEQSGDRLALDGVSYLWTQADIGYEAWTLHLLSDERALRTRAQLWVASALAVLLILLILAASLRARRLRETLAASVAEQARLQAVLDEKDRAQRLLSEAEEALARQRRLAALGQLSASITHELGQPIAAMRNYLAAEEIAQGTLPGELAPPLTRIVERMQRIVDQLRSFGRSPQIEQTTFDLAESIRRALALVEHDLDRDNIALSVRLAEDVFVMGEAERFEQVIINLVRNARDAVAQSTAKQISVEMSAEGEQAIIRVHDTGPGLGGADLAKLQEPFFTTKPSGEGMGLGLAISEQIISDLKGSMTAQTGADGGAIFEVRLPLA